MSNTAKKINVIEGGQMAKFRTKKVKPPVQRQFDFMMRQNVEDIVAKTKELHDSVQSIQPMNDTDHEACTSIADSIKDAIKRTGLSREQVVDAINEYFGRTEGGAKEDEPKCFNPLTINTFNNYLSKPTEYKIPAFYLFAIQHICNSPCMAKVLAENEGAKVLVGSEVKRFYLMKVSESIDTLKKAEKDLKNSL